MIFHDRPRLTFRRRRARKGLTLIEIMIATSISTIVMATVVGLQLLSARAVIELLGSNRTRSARTLALVRIRSTLSNAQIGTFVISDNNHRIQFIDPSLLGVTSALFFDTDSNTLFYDANINDGANALHPVKGPIDVTFEPDPLAPLAMILVKVRTESQISFGEVDSQEGETSVYLRNI
ncbi:prepilin-type N-terminal cleavage/methylation domain-containing protein [Candidatus Sumerlaeota bacterium]|nr:prepilin-type N-terminal cleavage/methylation domain-containing protein [Candidatus Sumerlaeota bacterium]